MVITLKDFTLIIDDRFNNIIWKELLPFLNIPLALPCNKGYDNVSFIKELPIFGHIMDQGHIQLGPLLEPNIGVTTPLILLPTPSMNSSQTTLIALPCL